MTCLIILYGNCTVLPFLSVAPAIPYNYLYFRSSFYKTIGEEKYNVNYFQNNLLSARRIIIETILNCLLDNIKEGLYWSIVLIYAKCIHYVIAKKMRHKLTQSLKSN